MCDNLNVRKDEVEWSCRGVVAGAGGDIEECTECSADVGADATTADIVYGYLCGATECAVRTKC